MLPPSKSYMIYDPELCTGCHVCEMICSFFKEGHIRPEAARLHVLMAPFGGTIENYMPLLCRQCDTPECMTACPVEGAIYIDGSTHARVVNASMCKADCGKCVEACKRIHTHARIILHPDTGKAIKCDLCQGEPACVAWCPNGAVRLVSRAEFIEGGGNYRQSFDEAFEKDFGPSFTPFKGEAVRYTGS